MKRFIQPDILFYLFLILVGIGGFTFAIVWPMTKGFYTFIICAALGGLGVTTYIYYAKRYLNHLACPAGSDCNVVVNSRYSKFLGIPLEYLGTLYYLIIVVSYTLLLFVPSFGTEFLISSLAILTAFAFFFSLYLLFIQAFILRQWCIWCLLSAALSILIFIVSLTSLSFAGEFLANISAVLLFVESLGFVFGMGGATAALFLFFRFLKSDFNIDDEEAGVLHGFSELVWLGIGLIFISMYAQYVVEHEILAVSGAFIIRSVALFVVLFSGAILNLLFAPIVSMLPFHTEKLQGEQGPSFLSLLRRWTLVTGAVGLSSWYFAFAVMYLSVLYSLSILFFVYALVLLAAILIALLIDQKLS